MSIGCSFQFYQASISFNKSSSTFKYQHLKVREHVQFQRLLSSHVTLQIPCCLHAFEKTNRPFYGDYRSSPFTCRSFSIPGSTNEIPVLKVATSFFARSYSMVDGFPLLVQLAPAVSFIAFAVWGLEPLARRCRSFFLQRNDTNWRKSRTRYFLISYLQPLLLWTGAMVVCRVLDPIIAPSEATHAVKQRLLNFFRSLSTVLAFTYCLSSLIEQAQKFFLEAGEVNDARKMGIQFAGKTVYTAVWVASISLFMELLGFSTQKWLTAGGLGTVLLTLAGREILTNFLSSVMIHATRPFVLNEWIQTRIEGYEVSGTVEHVGWWSPTVIRGDDREAVHIPNHKFTVTVVRNLSQKTHWRVKTHFAISHLDYNKISTIVADMRKVLSKNPQVEQQRLHRRVFLDYIDPENQAFMILVSCFVKTPRFEEYLGVKEGILLDLLRVISHHRARLATPIRTIQKVYGDIDLENVPVAETIITRGARNPINRPLYLIEPETRVNSDDKAKLRSTPQINEEQQSKNFMASDQKSTNPVSNDANLGDQQQQKVSPSDDPYSDSNGTTLQKGRKLKPSSLSESATISTIEELHTKVLNNQESITNNEIQLNPADSANLQVDDTQVAAPDVKQEPERPSPPASPVNRSPLEDNIVLGMALDGAKRTLPIEEGMIPSLSELKELASQRNGSGPTTSAKEKQDSLTKSQTALGGSPIDERDSDV